MMIMREKTTTKVDPPLVAIAPSRQMKVNVIQLCPARAKVSVSGDGLFRADQGTRATDPQHDDGAMASVSFHYCRGEMIHPIQAPAGHLQPKTRMR
jgi:hypothetical protein